ncbi:MAG: hypothetical protein HY585_00945 [Candidatus Omnitrophica bacterium]|nr:hypothetical protein [Candidatus Omnitrophota bacterium]
MKYSTLIHLKFSGGFSTQELMKHYPREANRISEIALLDLDKRMLEQVVSEKKTFKHLMYLKEKFTPPLSP